jgi:formamidopyrimidine-DNA glycosylase
LTDEQIKQLHTSIDYVCTTSVGVLADSEQFPEEWLFKHRWSKGKKNQPSVLPNGNKIVFLTVGGRTSAVVPSVQGPVAKEISDEDLEDVKEKKVAVNSKRKRTAVKEEDDDDDDKDEVVAPKRAASRRGTRSTRSSTTGRVKKERD